MNKYDVAKLRRLVKKELERRERINELLKSDLIREYIKLIHKDADLESTDIRNIIYYLSNNFPIKDTNKICVCMDAWYQDYELCYQETNWYMVNTPIDSKRAFTKQYKDIETGESFNAIRRIRNSGDYGNLLIHDVEKDYIVLNPYNTSKNKNGYMNVRLDFLENTYYYGQEKSKKLLLEKYPRI